MSNSLPKGLRNRGYNFFENGHRCGACHNVSDAQVRIKEFNLPR